MDDVKFISYDGAWPNLCSGVLTIEVKGKVYQLDHVLCSGGSVWFDADWMEHVESGPWSIHDLPENLKPYSETIIRLVNENVPQGCCGGCV